MIIQDLHSMTSQDIDEVLADIKLMNSRGEYHEAEKLAQHILTLSNTTQNQMTVALLELASTAWRQGDSNRALSLSSDGLELARKCNNKMNEANAWNIKGLVQMTIGLYLESIDYFMKALNLYQDIGEKSGAGRVMGNLGISYTYLNMYDKALEYNSEVLALQLELQEMSEVARITGNIGIIHLYKGNFQQALQNFLEASLLHEELREKSSLARITANIGMVYYSLGSFDLALDYLETAYTYHKELEERLFIAVDIGNIAMVYQKLGFLDKSLEMLIESLNTFEIIGSKTQIASVTGNIGVLYSDLESYEKALEYYRKAIILHTELGEKRKIAGMTGNIGNVYDKLRIYDKALEYHFIALAMHEELDDIASIACGSGNIGSTYFNMGLYEKALSYFDKARVIFESIEQKSDLARILANIAGCYANKEFDGYNVVLAEEFFLKSIYLEQHGFKLQLYSHHLKLANLYKQEKRWEEYSTHIEKYHQLYQEVQNEEVKKQADRFGWERKIAEMEKQKEIETVKTEADKRLYEETISFQKQSLEQQAREVKNTVEELVRKNSLLQLIQSDLKKIAPYTKKEGSDYIDQLLERVTRNITPLESNQQLDKQLTEVHGEFIHNLHQKFPDLTTMELKIAALLSMKLTSSNIAAALFLAKRTVESHRFSLRKKMGLGTSDDIYSELAKYSA